MNKYIDISFSPHAEITSSRKVFQYDYGLFLRISGVPSTGNFFVDYSVNGSTFSTTGLTVRESDVALAAIPDQIIAQPNDIVAYIRSVEPDGGQTHMTATIPVIERPVSGAQFATDNELAALDTNMQHYINALSDTVKYNTEQNLTDTQKLQARTNIKAASAAKLEEIESTLNSYAPIMNDIHQAIEENRDITIEEYHHPGYASRSSGLYKISVDNTGHVNEAELVRQSDIFPAFDANKASNVLMVDNYGNSVGWQDPKTGIPTATGSESGLMSSADKAKLDGINNATHQQSGFMSAEDKVKLDGLENYEHPSGDGNEHVPSIGTGNNNKILAITSGGENIAWRPMSELHPADDGQKHVPITSVEKAGYVLIVTNDGSGRMWKPVSDLALVTQDTHGIMRYQDKVKIDGLKNGAVRQIETGSLTVTVPAASGSTPGQVDATINFTPGTFSNRPFMIATHTVKNRINDYRIVSYADTEKTGIIRVTTTRTAQESVPVYWIAVK